MQEKLGKVRARAKILENVKFDEDRNYKEKDREIANNLYIPGKPRRRTLNHHTVNKMIIYIQCTNLNKRRKDFLQRRTLLMHCVIW